MSDKSAPADANADKPASSVKLTAFCLYRKKAARGDTPASVEALDGALDARLGADGHVELLAGPAPFRSKDFVGAAPAPGFGTLMLYGIRDTVEELYRWRNHARQIGADFASAEFEVEVGTLETGLTSRELLHAAGGKNRFLNVRRMTSHLQGQVLQAMRKYEPELTRVVEMAQHPELFDRVLLDDPDLRSLDVLVIPVADDPGSPNLMRQVAYVRPGAKVLKVHQGSDQATIYLPSWMSNEKEAKKMVKEALASA